MLDLQFSQSFGQEENQTDNEQISSLRFSEDYLAVGDVGGRVIMFAYKSQHQSPMLKKDRITSTTQMTPKFEFQAHTQEFDPIRSCEIESKVIEMQYIQKDLLLTCNEKEVKLWKLEEKQLFQHTDFFPKKTGTKMQANCKKIYNSLNNYHINSLSVSGEQFLIADDFNIKIQHFEDVHNSMLIKNITPYQMDQFLETITKAQISSENENIINYGTNLGNITILDMRYTQQGTESNITLDNAVMDIQSRKNELFTRTQNDFYIYDIRNLSEPVFHQPLYYAQPYGGKAQEKFNIALSTSSFATGYFGSSVNIGDSSDMYQFKASRQLKRSKSQFCSGVGAKQICKQGQINQNEYLTHDFVGSTNCMDFSDELLAVSLGGNLYLYGWIGGEKTVNQK